MSTPVKPAAKPTVVSKPKQAAKPKITTKKVEAPEAKKKPVSGELPKIKRGKTHSGQRAAEIVVRPTLRITREEADTAVVCWGRMNPPTKGHEHLAYTVETIADEMNAYPMLFLSRSMDVKNPLSLNERLSLAEDAFGEYVHVMNEASVVDPISLLKYVSEHFDKVIVVTGQEHEADYLRFFETYNGKDFEFVEMDVVVLERNTESAELVENISATKMRAYAAEGNIELFSEGLPDGLKMDAAYIMEQVRFGMSIQEAVHNPNPAIRALVNYRNKLI